MATLDREILPDGVKPINYAISLFDIEYGGAFTYQGAVNITAKILKATKEITLNYDQLKIQSGAVHVENAKTTYTFSHSEITYDVPKQRVTIKFAEEIPASETARILIKFEGTINNKMAGFYRSKYTPAVEPAASVAKDGDSHVMFSTQFESSDARQAFPCWDEPNIKATFDLDLEIPEDQVALSNMPEKSITTGKNGLKVVSFERSPIMSTYLLAWAIGDFEYVEEFTERKYNGKHLPVRVYTTKGLKEQGRYALEHAHKIIDYFSEIFKIDYPLPKSDLLAVHEFSHGAMENWGLVTYRTSAVLYDEGKTDPKLKNRVAYVVAHELAHQWFGNLVTMDWWSELWLNEGFATWVGWLAIEHFHPDWNVWPQFIAESMQSAFGLDALRSSHPIEVPVKDALDVAQIFDAISYLKGSSVIRMLAAHLGQEKFLNGVSNYLKAHAYGNATTTDLWSALSESSGQDVVTLMDPWIRKIGYPVITVAEEPGQVTVRQARYLSTGDVTEIDDEVTWWVPLSIKGKGTGSANDVVAFAIEKKEEVIRDINDDFYKLNADTTGFFRTNYPPARLAKLGKQVSQLSDLDKIGLVGDAGALAFSGYATTPSLLSFLEGFTGEDNYLVWQQITTSLGNVQSVFSDDVEIADALKKFNLKLIDQAVEKIGWKLSPGEDYLTGQLRALLIKTAGLNGNAAVIKEAQRQFALFANELDTSVIDASLLEAVFVIVVKYGSAQEYETLKRFYIITTATDGKELCVRGLAKVQIPELLPNFLQFLFHEVVVQDVHYGAATFVANSKSRIILWAYIKEHFDEIKSKYGANISVISRLFKSALGQFSDYETEKDIADFFKDKDIRGYDRGLANVSDQIKGRAGYRERDGAITLEWLKANHYA